MSTLTLPALDVRLSAWLDSHAGSLDDGAAEPADITPQLAEAGIFSVGVTPALGGNGGTIADAILAVASIATRSLTAAFVCWGQRTFIEYLLHSPNERLREAWLPALLDGRHAGATGLSNAMKYLGGIESLQVRAADTPDGLVVNGKLPWVTNLRKQGFLVAAVTERSDGSTPSIIAIPHDADGVLRSPDLDLVAMRSSNTAAVDLAEVRLSHDWIIDNDALRFLARVRPAFLGLQCGLSIGLAHRCLDEAARAGDALADEIDDLANRLAAATQRLVDGVSTGTYRVHAAPLFELRIELADIVSAAAALEVQAAGGRGYLRSPGFGRADASVPIRESGVARRWREAAFVPIVTPSLTQLKHELARRAASTAA